MQTQSVKAPTFLEFFIYWLKLGFISFGGPAGQISMMHQELVEKRITPWCYQALRHNS